MTTKETNKPNTTAKDLIDRIAEALPDKEKAEYYREMTHLKSLPENDEMLRIIRIMGYLTLLAEQVPSKILTEREKFEVICHEVITIGKRLESTGNEYYKWLHKHLTELPTNIASGISPTAIVERINDSLKKQFELSTIPILATQLAANAADIKSTAREFTSASDELTCTWKSATEKAHKAIGEINTTIKAAVAASEKARDQFIRSFNKIYFWILGMAALIFFSGGMMFCDYLDTKNTQAESKQTQVPKTSAPKSQQPANPTPKKK